MNWRIPATILVICLIPSSATASQQSSVSSLDLGHGMISTAPVDAGDLVLVKSIGWLTAINITTEEVIWEYPHSTPHFFETSPPLVLDSTVITGWSDGYLSAHHLANGTELWNLSTGMSGYGITGSLLMVDEGLLVPTDHGLVLVNPTNGELEWEVSVNTTTFYRSTPLVSDGRVLLGGEDGRVLVIYEDRTVGWIDPPESMVDPHVRGRILEMDDGRLLIPIQAAEGGGLVEYDGSNSTVHLLAGPLGLLAESDGFVVLSSSTGSRILDCRISCSTTLELTSDPVVGEVLFDDGRIVLPVNDGTGFWSIHDVDCNESGCVLSSSEKLRHSRPQYLTAAPLYVANATIIGNDAGWIDIVRNVPLQDDNSVNETNVPDESWLILALPTTLLIITGVNFKGSRRHLPAVLMTCLLLLVAANIDTINNLIVDDAESDSDWLSNHQIPEGWVGTQVVIFELGSSAPGTYLANDTWVSAEGAMIEQEEGSGIILVGGLSGFKDARDLTKAACAAAGIRYEEHREDMGYRVDRIGDAIDGKGDAWLLYHEDGILSPLAVDLNPVQERVFIIWSIE